MRVYKTQPDKAGYYYVIRAYIDGTIHLSLNNNSTSFHTEMWLHQDCIKLLRKALRHEQFVMLEG
ncbi:MAG: hypothetical protein GTO02_13595 [Candidatus Dadabacteria bacterium]|nr:hypothetical protein [Candidatus Dadabacteria bacterium]